MHALGRGKQAATDQAQEARTHMAHGTRHVARGTRMGTGMGTGEGTVLPPIYLHEGGATRFERVLTLLRGSKRRLFVPSLLALHELKLVLGLAFLLGDDTSTGER